MTLHRSAMVLESTFFKILISTPSPEFIFFWHRGYAFIFCCRVQKLTNLQSRRRWRGTALVAHAPFNFWPGTVGPGSKGTIYPPAIIWQNYKQNNLLLLLVSQPDCHTFHCLCWQYRKQKNKNRQSITVVSFQFLDIPTALTFLGPKCANCATKTCAIFLFLFFFSFAWKRSNGVKPCFKSCRWIFVRSIHSCIN